MSYADRRQDRTVAIGAVVVVHAAIGYALLTGLATHVIRAVASGPLETYDVPVVPPPPPEPQVLPKTDTMPSRPVERFTAPPREVPTVSEGTLTAYPIDLGPVLPIPDALPGPAAAPPPAPAVSLARGAAPRGNQGSWFPPDSYPAAAQRASAEGLVSVRVTVGADGRVADCAVVSSSGNADLDGATCRLARRNGRFDAARDREGNAVASSYTLRNVRWRLVE